MTTDEPYTPGSREALSELLMKMYDHGSQPNALVEADYFIASDWLRAHDAEVLERAAEDYTNHESGTKARPHARTWLRNRAARIRRGEGE